MIAPLHPDRIRQALAALASDQYSDDLMLEHRETCVAALQFLQKCQQKMGLTPSAADFGAHVFGVLKGLKSLR